MLDAYELFGKAKELGLEIQPRVLAAVEADPSVVGRIYNGVGPEWLDEEYRNLLDSLSEVLLPSVCIHDLDFHFGDGTVLDFMRANRRLEKNGIICADAAKKWYNPRRYTIRRQARLYSRACDLLGMSAYVAAVEGRAREKTDRG
jgi:hypothetical protein